RVPHVAAFHARRIAPRIVQDAAQQQRRVLDDADAGPTLGPLLRGLVAVPHERVVVALDVHREPEAVHARAGRLAGRRLGPAQAAGVLDVEPLARLQRRLALAQEAGLRLGQTDGELVMHARRLAGARRADMPAQERRARLEAGEPRVDGRVGVLG